MIVGSLLSAKIALFSLMVILEGGDFTLTRVSNALISTSEELSLLVFIADSVAVMGFTIGSCCGEKGKFRPFSRPDI